MSRNAGNDEFGNFDDFGKDANKLNTWKPAVLADLVILVNVTNLAKFRQIAK